MKNIFKHGISVAVSTVFILFAISSSDNFEPSCQTLLKNYKDLGYYLCDLLPVEINKQNNFNLKILDKTNSLPVAGIRVGVSWIPMNLQKKTCDEYYEPENCYGHFSIESLSYADTYQYFTDENGEISGTTEYMKYVDKRDNMVVSFHIEDPSGKYSSKNENMRFIYNTGSMQKTIYLLNNSEL